MFLNEQIILKKDDNYIRKGHAHIVPKTVVIGRVF